MVRRKYDKDCGNLSFHLIQSFTPGEIPPQEAHNIAMELIKNIAPKHQAVITTHIDKDHIHNHIIFNSVSLEGKRYYDNKKTYKVIQQVNDRLCKDHNLNIVLNPQNKGMAYKEWQENKKNNSWKAQIKEDINKAISYSSSYEEFLNIMKNEFSYKIKKGKYLSFKPKTKERFVRDRTLGKEYTYENILEKISLKNLGYTFKSLENSTQKVRFRINKISKKKYRKIGIIEKRLRILLHIIRNPVNDNLKLQITHCNKQIQKISNLLSFIKKENIFNDEILQYKLNESRKKTQDYLLDFKKEQEKNNQMKKVYETLIHYQDYKKYFNQYKTIGHENDKKAYLEQNVQQIHLFLKFKKILEENNFKNQDDIFSFLKKFDDNKRLCTIKKIIYDEEVNKLQKYKDIQDFLQKDLHNKINNLQIEK